MLELRDVNGVLLQSNDNWKLGRQAEIQATGFAPPNDAEPALLANLSPGNYTAIVRGKNNTTGGSVLLKSIDCPSWQRIGKPFGRLVVGDRRVI